MPDERLERDEPVSLAPLDPETALRGLLAVKPAGKSPENEEAADPPAAPVERD